MIGERLGQGAWRWEHRDRAGTILGSVSTGDTGWAAAGNRRVDRYSEASLTVGYGCCNSVRRATFGQEIWLYRTPETRPVYIGVIRTRTIDLETNQVTLDLADRSWWWTGRPLIFYTGPSGELAGGDGVVGTNLGEIPDVAVVTQLLVSIGDTVAPVGLTMSVPSGFGTSGVTMAPRVSRRAQDTVYDAMVKLGDTLIDWTVVADTLFVDAPEFPWTPIMFDLTSSWVAPVSITESGEGFATQVSATGDLESIATYPAFNSGLIVDPVRGYYWVPVDGGSQNDGLGVLSQIAKTDWERAHNPIVQMAVSDSALSCDVAVSFNHLLPGRRCVINTHGVCGMPQLVQSRIAEVQWETEAGVDTRISVDIETLGAVKDEGD